MTFEYFDIDRFTTKECGKDSVYIMSELLLIKIVDFEYLLIAFLKICR